MSGTYVYAATLYEAAEVSYDNSSSGTSNTNVQTVLDELYGLAEPDPVYYGLFISHASNSGYSAVLDTHKTSGNRLLLSGYANSPSGYSETTGYLQGSSDGSSWATVKQFTQQGYAHFNEIITSNYRYFRFYATGKASYYGLWTRLTIIQ